MTESFITIALIFMVVARLTRIITTDRITEKPRLALVTRLGPDSGLVYLAHCQWCMSVWLGAIGAGIAVWLAPIPGIDLWVQGVGLAAAFSYGTGWMAEQFAAPAEDRGEA